jgi:hypothetical protein
MENIAGSTIRSPELQSNNNNNNNGTHHYYYTIPNNSSSQLTSGIPTSSGTIYH